MLDTKKDNRARTWATVVYPESAPEAWQSILAEYVIPAFISPLHNLDLNPTGEEKKAHYHVVLMFEGKKSKLQVEEIFKAIGGVGCEYVQSVRGYARYLCHLDNPEKAQYSQDDVVCLGGSDYAYTIGLVTDKYKAIGEMIDFCADNNVVSYSELVEYARDNRSDWFRTLCDNGTVVMKEYLKSKVWTSSYKQR